MTTETRDGKTVTKTVITETTYCKLCNWNARDTSFIHVNLSICHSIHGFFSVPDGSKTVSTKTNISTEGAISTMAQRQVYPLHKLYAVWSQVVFSMGYGPRCQTVSSYLIINSRMSKGKMAPWVFFHFCKFNTNLSAIHIGPLVIMHVVARGILSHWPNTMSKFLEYQLLADRLVLNLEKVEKLKVPFFLLIFYYWSWGHKTFFRH